MLFPLTPPPLGLTDLVIAIAGGEVESRAALVIRCTGICTIFQQLLHWDHQDKGRWGRGVTVLAKLQSQGMEGRSGPFQARH